MSDSERDGDPGSPSPAPANVEGAAGAAETGTPAAESAATESAPAAPAAPAAGSAPDAPPGGTSTPAAAADAEAAPEPPASPEPAPRAAAPRTARRSALAERPDTIVERPQLRLAAQTRRDFLVFGAGVVAAAAAAWWLAPDGARSRLLPQGANDLLDTVAARGGLTKRLRERLLDRALTFDDDVAEALYSPSRTVRTYDRSQATRALRNNYDGRTPSPEYLPGWTLTLAGLASGRTERLTIDALRSRFAHREQVTRLVCVEGWSAVAWWGGLRFAELLAAFPPAPGARWAALRSEVNLDAAGRPDPYYVSIDLGTASHPQTLLATQHNGQPLPLAHGAPLRLLVPVKLGLKNIKAITHVTYSASEPPDYWNRRGYSRYDGL